MKFKTLANIGMDELLSVFNLSFSDYIVPFHLTKEALTFKISSEKIDLNISVGAFENGILMGFILQAEKMENGRKVIYNGGTGIVPEGRGKGLVRKMYDFIIPVLKERGAETLILEVIEGNQPAIRAYENLGFSVVRKLLCFNGNMNSIKGRSDIAIKELSAFQWETFLSFWDIEPSWQGAVFVLEGMKEHCVILGAFKDEVMVGYAVHNPTVKKILQVAVHKDHRREGVGTRLFDAIGQNNGRLVSVNNVDEVSEGAHQFLGEKMGLKNWISQFEMKRAI